MYYNPSMIGDEKCVSLVYKILNRSTIVLDKEHIRNMVKRQATLLPKSSKFDYRTLFEAGKDCILDKYFDRELMDVINHFRLEQTYQRIVKLVPITKMHDDMCYNG